MNTHRMSPHIGPCIVAFEAAAEHHRAWGAEPRSLIVSQAYFQVALRARDHTDLVLTVDCFDADHAPQEDWWIMLGPKGMVWSGA
jgi:hypothetical protein